MKLAKDIAARGRVLGNGQGPLVCVPVVARSRDAILDDGSAVAREEPDLIEWRADFFDGVAAPGEVLSVLADLRERGGDIPLIFTLRTEREGGEPVALDDIGIAQLCIEVCNSGLADFVDVEMSAPEEHIRRVLAAAREHNTQVVLSYHNFNETPVLEDLLAQFARAQGLGGDVAKVAVMPRCLDDVLVLLEATLRAGRELRLPLVSISMGPLGALTRVTGWSFGSAVTFAAGRQSSAPGQISLQDVREAVGTLARLQLL